MIKHKTKNLVHIWNAHLKKNLLEKGDNQSLPRQWLLQTIFLRPFKQAGQ